MGRALKTKTDKEWASLIRMFKKEKGRLPKRTDSYKGHNVGNACINLRQKRKKGRLNKEAIKQLNELGFLWSRRTKTDQEWVDLIKIFKKDKNRFPRQYEEYQGEHIGTAFYWLKHKKKTGKLNEKAAKQLAAAGISWKLQKTTQEWVDLLVEFKNKRGRMPETAEKYKNERIGIVCSSLRYKKRTGRLNKEIIKQLNNLGFDWGTTHSSFKTGKEWIELIKEFKEDQGRFPTRLERDNGHNIGMACSNFKQKKKRGELNKELEKELEDIGFVWRRPVSAAQAKVALIKKFKTKIKRSTKYLGNIKKPVRKAVKYRSNAIEKWISLLEKFKKEKNRLPECQEEYDKMQIGAACNYLKQKKKSGALDIKIVRQLDEMGFVWGKATHAKKYWAALIEKFKKEKGRFPLTTEVYENKNIGTACRVLRQNMIKGKLPKEVIEQLDRIGFVWKENKNTSQDWADLLESFKKQKGRFPLGKEMYKQEKIWQAVPFLRLKKKKGKLERKVIRQLAETGFSWQAEKKTDKYWISLIKEFKKAKGRFPHVQEKYKGEKIGIICSRFRLKKKGGELNDKTEKQLIELGFVFKARNKAVQKWVAVLRKFKKEKGRFPAQIERYRGRSIGRACSHLRQRKKAGKLNKDIIKKLDKIGFVWEVGHKTPEDWIKLLKEFKKAKGRFPKTIDKYKGANIGSACILLRSKKNKHVLNRKIIKELNAIGFK